MKTKIIVTAICAVVLVITGTIQAQSKQPLRLVSSIDFTRYAGQWYEIARLPNRFQKKCAGEVVADYKLRPDGQITVLNLCQLENGTMTRAEGLARIAGKGLPNSALKVRFAPTFLTFIPQVWGNYQVISLSSDYSHALVGDPSREYLWILSRTPTLNDTIYEQLVGEAKAQGFNVNLLQKTRQSRN